MGHDGYNSNSSCQEAEDVCGTYYFHDETQQEGRKHADWDCTDKPRYGWGCCIRLQVLLLRSRVPALEGCLCRRPCYLERWSGCDEQGGMHCHHMHCCWDPQHYWGHSCGLSGQSAVLLGPFKTGGFRATTGSRT